jgi:flagellar biosynthesis/type III secretory pathway M-ring protein FliF/YscJ
LIGLVWEDILITFSFVMKRVLGIQCSLENNIYTNMCIFSIVLLVCVIIDVLVRKWVPSPTEDNEHQSEETGSQQEKKEEEEEEEKDVEPTPIRGMASSDLDSNSSIVIV